MAPRLDHIDSVPSPPVHNQRHALRQRGFSITSDKSATSKRSDGREKLKESHDEKSARKLSISTKANPNAAMNELQPIAQQLQPATMGCLRDTKYMDLAGNPITDPDLSNPTRRRTERPLETILSFESAIDREFRKQREANRQSFAQNDSDDSGYFGYPQKKRTSYWADGGDYAGNGYYTHGSPSRRSQFDAPPSRNKYSARQHSDLTMNRYENAYSVYSTPGYGMTRDTIITGISNGSATDPWHNSTNPSSDNTSIERFKTDGGENNNNGGYPTPHREPISEDGHYTYGKGGPHAPHISVAPITPDGQTPGPPSPPRHANMGGPVSAPTRQVISLSGGSDVNNGPGVKRPTVGEQPKRKSWLKRTFSKNKG